MKTLLLIITFACLLVCKVSAQGIPPAPPMPVGKNIDIKDAVSHVGEYVNLCDTIYYYNATKDSTTVFTMGGRYPKQLLKVVVYDHTKMFNVDNLIGKPMCVCGTIALKNNKMEMVVEGPQCILFYSYPKVR